MPNSSSSQYLYRIIRFDRLVQMLKTNEWHFAHPSTWEDPSEVRTRNKLSDMLFAQCWCRNGVSDAMWRIYSQDKLGVRIRVSRDRLKSALYDLAEQRNIGFHIAPVKYVNEMEYTIRTNKMKLELERRVTFVRASAHLYLKRPAFAHEAETRVVLIDFDQSDDEKPKGHKITLNTRQLIESVLVDPRAPNEYVEAYRHYLKDELNFLGTVEKSQLYKSYEVREL
ncbi:DUF2971 domain-containing protein [Rhodoferax saidenbachensis]|uniref:DUF2971 domain-containing protein n=1 Tax=Rhodoferax saidenbachensis TaxID=1484693 RepID=A0ABU1ZJL2_9BURK|nr:DUF2971 domain-containing protein [Rhodoferax saidenbachensis]MDR7305126.1 hypothetical protein [Rhodoferax saidenbachensis]